MEKLTIADGELYMAVPGRDLTMTVSGVGTNMKPGTYENVTLTVTESHLKTTRRPRRPSYPSLPHGAVCEGRQDRGREVRSGCDPRR